MTLSFRMASATDFRQECGLLREMHFVEAVAHRGGNLAVDFDFYEELDKTGNLRIILAYDEETPVGYIINLVHDDPHDETRLQATMDMVYVSPEYRKERAGVTLYKLAEIDLAAFAPGAIWRTSVPIDGASSAKQRRGLESFGFTAIERVYEKAIGAE